MITGAPLFFGVLISPSAHAVPSESCNLPWLGGVAWPVMSVESAGLAGRAAVFSWGE
jgi:hypothetical protein